MRESRFYYYLKVVTIVHIVLLALCLCWNDLGRFFRKEKVIVPVEFVVAVPPASIQQASAVAPVPLMPRTAPKPKPVPRLKKPHEVNVSNTRVRRNTSRNAVQESRLLSPEEIEKRLKMGATAGDHNTVIPDEDARGFARIRQALYDAWIPPDRETVDDAHVEAVILISADGTLISKKISGKSGIGVMDASVDNMLRSMRRIPGLSPGFLKRHANESITITFKVE